MHGERSERVVCEWTAVCTMIPVQPASAMKWWINSGLYGGGATGPGWREGRAVPYGAGELRTEDGCGGTISKRRERRERGREREDSLGKVMKHAAQVSCLWCKASVDRWPRWGPGQQTPDRPALCNSPLSLALSLSVSLLLFLLFSFSSPTVRGPSHDGGQSAQRKLLCYIMLAKNAYCCLIHLYVSNHTHYCHYI